MNPFANLTEFFEQINIQFRIVDMGQRVQKLEKSQFRQFEQFEIPYPFPFLKHAWVGVLFWPKQPLPEIEPVIWFLKLPLDELGQLQPAARDDLIRRLMEQFASSALAKQKAEQSNQTTQLMTEDLLKDNPYSFQPSQEKMAIFHSLAATWLKKDLSKYYQTCLSYLSGDQGWNNWQHLGMQGLADAAVALQGNKNEALIINALPHLPAGFLEYFAQCLENITLPQSVENKIISLAESSDSSEKMLSWIRCLASCANDQAVHQVLLKHLDGHPSIEALAIIATKLQPAMLNESVRKAWLEQVAKLDSHTFMALIGDLMFQPKFRSLLMDSFRDPNRSEMLSEKIGLLFGNN